MTPRNTASPACSPQPVPAQSRWLPLRGWPQHGGGGSTHPSNLPAPRSLWALGHPLQSGEPPSKQLPTWKQVPRGNCSWVRPCGRSSGTVTPHTPHLAFLMRSLQQPYRALSSSFKALLLSPELRFKPEPAGPSARGPLHPQGTGLRPGGPCP